MNLVTVFRTFNPAEAQLIRSLLESAGLQPILKHELSSLMIDGYSMAAGGIKVEVPADQAEDARNLIDSRNDAAETET